jgi:hypothetical protein
MKNKNLIILALIVVAVGAYILLVERHRPSSEEMKTEADKVLQGFDRDEVTGIVVRLEKVGGAWRLREPVDFAADESAVSSTLGTLANLEAERRLAADEVDPAAYGLDDPPIEIRLRTGDGSETVLEVGNEIPLGSKRALRLAGADEIVVVPGWFISDIEREVDDWRSREVVDISEDQVASIDIGAGERCRRGQNSRGAVARPLAAPRSGSGPWRSRPPAEPGERSRLPPHRRVSRWPGGSGRPQS